MRPRNHRNTQQYQHHSPANAGPSAFAPQKNCRVRCRVRMSLDGDRRDSAPKIRARKLTRRGCQHPSGMSVSSSESDCWCLVIQLRVPSDQVTSSLGPRPQGGGTKRPPPSTGTAKYAGLLWSVEGCFVWRIFFHSILQRTAYRIICPMLRQLLIKLQLC